MELTEGQIKDLKARYSIQSDDGVNLEIVGEVIDWCKKDIKDLKVRLKQQEKLLSVLENYSHDLIDKTIEKR